MDKILFCCQVFKMLGYNYRLTDIQGALGVSQIKKAEKIMDNRRKIAQKYDRALKDISQFVLPRAQEGFKHGYQSYVCLFGGEEVLKMDSIEKVDAMHIKRNLFMQKLEALVFLQDKVLMRCILWNITKKNIICRGKIILKAMLQIGFLYLYHFTLR